MCVVVGVIYIWTREGKSGGVVRTSEVGGSAAHVLACCSTTDMNGCYRRSIRHKIMCKKFA